MQAFVELDRAFHLDSLVAFQLTFLLLVDLELVDHLFLANEGLQKVRNSHLLAAVEQEDRMVAPDGPCGTPCRFSIVPMLKWYT